MPSSLAGARGPGEPGLHRTVAVSAVLGILLGGALLDALGIAFFPATPVAGPLLVIAILALLQVRSREGMTIPRPGSSLRDGHLRPGDLLVLAVAVPGSGVALELARPLLVRWTFREGVEQSLAAPLFRLGMGGALLATVAGLLLLVPRFRRKLRGVATGRRLRSGLFFTVAVVLVVYGVLLGVGQAVAGPGAVGFRMPLFVPASLALLLAQIAIAVGEEMFYRGLLQGEVTRLLGRAGIRRPRERKLLALVGVSALFALHHVSPSMPAGLLLSVLLYSFAMSLLFGFLFDLTRNLAVCSLAHLFNNLMVLRLAPSLTAPGAEDAFGDGVYIAAFLLVAFSFLFLLNRTGAPSVRGIRPT